MKNALWVTLLAMALAFTPIGVCFAGKGTGGTPAPGSQGTTRMENEEQYQRAREHDGMGRGDQEKIRTHNCEQERKRLEEHYRKRAMKLEEKFDKEQKQLRSRYEEQKRTLEQEQHQKMLQLEKQYPNSEH